MPTMPANTAIRRTTRRFLKQSATNWSIIEPDSALYDDALAGLQSGLDHGGSALLIGDLDIAAFEGPIGDLDEDARPVVGHHQRRGRHDQPRRRRRNESGVGEHIGL